MSWCFPSVRLQRQTKSSLWSLWSKHSPNLHPEGSEIMEGSGLSDLTLCRSCPITRRAMSLSTQLPLLRLATEQTQRNPGFIKSIAGKEANFSALSVWPGAHSDLLPPYTPPTKTANLKKRRQAQTLMHSRNTSIQVLISENQPGGEEGGYPNQWENRRRRKIQKIWEKVGTWRRLEGNTREKEGEEGEAFVLLRSHTLKFRSWNHHVKTWKNLPHMIKVHTLELAHVHAVISFDHCIDYALERCVFRARLVLM